MKTLRITTPTLTLALTLLCVCNSPHGTAQAQSTAVIYQGRLHSGASPASVTYDL